VRVGNFDFDRFDRHLGIDAVRGDGKTDEQDRGGEKAAVIEREKSQRRK
jgi:hypothetical protein